MVLLARKQTILEHHGYMDTSPILCARSVVHRSRAENEALLEQGKLVLRAALDVGQIGIMGDAAELFCWL